MTREEAIEFGNMWLQMNEDCKDSSTYEFYQMAIKSLEAWEKVRQEINDLFSKPACYMPNYDAYKMFLEIMDKHLRKVSESEGIRNE